MFYDYGGFRGKVGSSSIQYMWDEFKRFGISSVSRRHNEINPVTGAMTKTRSTWVVYEYKALEHKIALALTNPKFKLYNPDEDEVEIVKPPTPSKLIAEVVKTTSAPATIVDPHIQTILQENMRLKQQQESHAAQTAMLMQMIQQLQATQQQMLQTQTQLQEELRLAREERSKK